MVQRVGTIAESNSVAESILNGNLAAGSLAGMTVIGVNFAGLQSGNVGSEFLGIYGSLRVNADGSFTYRLDNTDTDTDLLASGDTAIERFVITYRLGSVTQTLAIEIAIDGLDEPGQVITVLDESITVLDDFVVERDERIFFTTPTGYLEGISDDSEPRWDFTNFGSISVIANSEQPSAGGVGATPPLGRTYNEGRVRAEGAENGTGTIAAVGGFGENHGVASAVYSGPEVPGNISARAVGWEGLLVNTGLVEAVSTLDAYGVWAFNGHGTINTGVIYVEGGSAYTSATRTDPLGIIGFRSGGTGPVDNQGTVHVVSNTPFVQSVGFSFFPNSTNIYNPMAFNNSGTIVADRAIIALDGFQVSTHLMNSGHIEGTLELDRGVNQITNTATGSWFGDWTLALSPDLVENAGEIVGTISLRSGDDFYRGTPSGTVSGLVSGGTGNDVLQGGDGSDRLSGDEGQDWLSGGGGADQLTGGSGADVFFYRSASESTAAHRDIIADFQTGSDRIDISAIAATGFTLTLSGSNTILRATTASGTLEVLINGSFSSTDIITQAASVTLTGTSASDILVAILPGSTVSGGDGNDALHGTVGDDLLDGGVGADTMYGGAGNDIFIHDNSSDLIIEGEHGGIDEIRSWIGAFLPTYVENGRLLGAGNGFLIGSQFDNILIGNAGNNLLRGNGGNNTLIGGLGADTLYMNIGNQTAVYNSVQESSRGQADIMFYFNAQDDSIDLNALDVEYFTVGEYSRRLEAGGAGAFWTDMAVVSVMTSSGELVIEVDVIPTMDMFQWQRASGTGATLFGLDLDDTLNGSRDADIIDGRGGNDDLRGMGGADRLTGGLGNDTISGGSNIDTAIVSGTQGSYTITQTSSGVFQITGADGSDTLNGVEYLQFDDSTLRLLPGSGVSVNFMTADPSVYQASMNNIRDFDGNALGGNGGWLRIGAADVNGDGDTDQILVNQSIGRLATVGTADDGLTYFDDYSWAGETRVVGIYIDPLVASGDVVAGSDNDSQRRFQNDLEIENINRVLGADDYDGDGLQEVYLALTDGSAYLHAYMHADGNIQYANYQSQQQVIDFLTANGFDASTYADWFPIGADAGQQVDNNDLTAKTASVSIDAWEHSYEANGLEIGQIQMVEVFA